MTARDASIKLGKNPKYIYFLWKRGSNMLLDGSVKMMGSTLLITKEGYEHLKELTKIESDLTIKQSNSQVYNEVVRALLSSRMYIILN